MSDTLTDAAEDRTLRHWTFRGPARVKIGSDAHKQMFCRMLLETPTPYKPAVIEWRPLPPDTLERLCSLPIWDIAAQQSGYFPEALVETFEPVIQEEARHILLFANWVAWHRCTMPWWRRPWHALRVAAIWAVLIWQRVAIAKGLDAQGVAHDSNFLPESSKMIGEAIEVRELIELCLAENDWRMSGYDARLVPALARFALRFMKPSRRNRQH